jgi:hypothetical protein
MVPATKLYPELKNNNDTLPAILPMIPNNIFPTGPVCLWASILNLVSVSHHTVPVWLLWYDILR